MSTNPVPSRRHYEPPQVFRVELHHEQAILSACHIEAGTISNPAATLFCRGPSPVCTPTSGCKRSNASGCPSLTPTAQS